MKITLNVVGWAAAGAVLIAAVVADYLGSKKDAEIYQEAEIAFREGDITTGLAELARVDGRRARRGLSPNTLYLRTPSQVTVISRGMIIALDRDEYNGE